MPLTIKTVGGEVIIPDGSKVGLHLSHKDITITEVKGWGFNLAENGTKRHLEGKAIDATNSPSAEVDVHTGAKERK